jgi:hypothetical protein
MGSRMIVSEDEMDRALARIRKKRNAYRILVGKT